jgi:hypothetical protein
MFELERHRCAVEIVGTPIPSLNSRTMRNTIRKGYVNLWRVFLEAGITPTRRTMHYTIKTGYANLWRVFAQFGIDPFHHYDDDDEEEEVLEDDDDSDEEEWDDGSTSSPIHTAAQQRTLNFWETL